MGQETLAKPLILNQGSFTSEDVNNLRKNNKIWYESDLYTDQLCELFEINHPELRHDPKFEVERKAFIELESKKGGSWVYFPWNGHLIHIVSEKDLLELTTNRNKNLITSDEQEKLKDFTVGVLGMSVGNGIALSMVYSGIGHSIKIADFDKLETCNLNRLRAGIHRVGASKVTVAAQQIYEANPYIELEQFPDGVKEKDLERFFVGASKLNLVFDEIDDFVMKIRIRQYARRQGVPVVMLTSLGDNVLIDVERYDLDENTPIFNGLLGDIPDQILNENAIGEREKVKYAMQLVGVDYIPTRALGSLLEINKTLVGRPQLYSTIAVDGGLAAYLAKRIALGWDLPGGRMYLPFDKALGLSPTSEDNILRNEILAKLKGLTG